MKNQSGFFTVAAVALIPLVLSVFAILSAFGFVMKNHSDATQLCRLSLLKSQAKAALELNSLIKLNRRAEKLRAQLEEAKALASNPLTAETGAAMLTAVSIQQAELSAEQQIHIGLGRLTSQQAPQVAALQVNRIINEAARVQSDTRSARSFQSGRQRQGQFNVIAAPADSVTPNYEPAPTFPVDQEANLQIDVPITTVLPGWIYQLLGLEENTPLKLRAKCSATLKKGDDQKWEPTLSEDKS